MLAAWLQQRRSCAGLAGALMNPVVGGAPEPTDVRDGWRLQHRPPAWCTSTFWALAELSRAVAARACWPSCHQPTVSRGDRLSGGAPLHQRLEQCYRAGLVPLQQNAHGACGFAPVEPQTTPLPAVIYKGPARESTLHGAWDRALSMVVNLGWLCACERRLGSVA